MVSLLIQDTCKKTGKLQKGLRLGVQFGLEVRVRVKRINVQWSISNEQLAFQDQKQEHNNDSRGKKIQRTLCFSIFPFSLSYTKA
jgi:hypothetical protein